MNHRITRPATRAASLLAVAVVLSSCAEQKPLALEPEQPVDASRLYDVRLMESHPGAQPAEPGNRGVTFEVNAAPLPSAGQAELVTNGSFESNGGVNSPALAGWTSVNAGNGNWFAQSGGNSPPPGVFAVPTPPAGGFAAMTSQGGPGSHILYQDITLPATGNGQLYFRLFIGNRAGAFFTPSSLSQSGFANQQFRMDVMDPTAPVASVGAGVLLNVYQTRPGDVRVLSGYITVTANLSAFNGQTVRLRFAEVDNQGFFQAGIDDVSVIATVNQPPTADAGPDQVVECTGATTSVQLDGTATDADNNIASVQWFDGTALVATGEDAAISLPHGTHTLTMVVTDAAGETASDDVTIDVVDTTAPSAAVTASPGTLWPANHKYVAIDLDVAVSDDCDDASALTVTATAVSSDPDDANGNGDGNTTGDVKAGANVSSNAAPVVSFNPATDQLELRAERAGRTGARIYTITITVADTHGNTSVASTTVTVPHNQ